MKRLTSAFLVLCLCIFAAVTAHAQQLTMLVDVSDAAWNSSGSLTVYSAAITAANQRVALNKPFTIVAYDPGGLAKSRADELLAVPIFKNALCSQVYQTTAFMPNVTPPPPPPPPNGNPFAGVALGISPALNGNLVYQRADNWWNLRVDTAPLDPRSDEIITAIYRMEGTGGQCHPDFTPSYGIPYVVVDNATPLSPVTFNYASESDVGPYPIPVAAKTDLHYFENNGGSDGDRHMLLLNRDTAMLYELSYANWDGSKWNAGAGAIFDLKINGRRPDGWTSTDAAGLAVLAGLVRPDELWNPDGSINTDPIRHALRFSCKKIGKGFDTRGYVWPASHQGSADTGAPPLGMRVRLKASKDISTIPMPYRKVFQAWKDYGGICADRGGNMYWQGVLSSKWDNGVINPLFHKFTVRDFEVIQLGWGKP